MMKPLDQQIALEIRYERAIKLLLDLGLDHSCHHAKVAADVLLSANRADITPYRSWPLYISDLRILHEGECNAALGVIHGRVTLNRLPEIVIQGGPALFHRLWHRWRNIEEW